jgi:DNA-binding response OmpR family regulator
MGELAADLPADHGGLLVVDDEPFLRDAVAASLRFLGFDVTTADNGADALRLARDGRFDLLVLDVMLPELDGFDVVRRLRRDGSRVPVIFLTARDTQADKVTGLTIGGDDYLTKPFGLEELAARIRSVLRRTRPDRSGGPGQLPGPAGRGGDRVVADRVPAAALPHAQSGPGADPGPAAGPRVGLRLRRFEHGRRHLHRLSAA